MFSRKLIQKKINSRTRDDILSSKLEAKKRRLSENVCENNNKKSTKKGKKKNEVEKRKIEAVPCTDDSNDSDASKQSKDDHATFTEEEKGENCNKIEKSNNVNLKSKFARYFHVTSIDSDINSSKDDNSEENTILSTNSNLDSFITKSIQNEEVYDNKVEKDRPKDNLGNSNINKNQMQKPNMAYRFIMDESETSEEEDEEEFEPRLPSSEDTREILEVSNETLEIKTDDAHKIVKSNETIEIKPRENSSEVHNLTNEIKQVGNVVEGYQKSRRHQQRKILAAAEKEQQMIEKLSLVSTVVAVEAVSDDKLAVALFPGKRVYFNGTVLVTPLLGSVNIMGYTIKMGSSHIVSSPASQSLLGLLPQDSEKITPLLEEKLLKAGVSQQFINRLKDYPTDTTVLLLSRCDVPSLTFLKTLDCKLMNLPWNAKGKWVDVLDAELITEQNYKRYGLLKESEEWISIIDKLLLDYKQGKCLKVLICGGQRTGKSTLFKYVINSFLNSDCSIKNVHCIDLDPGQPEFSLPTTMSCATISQPLLEPSFAHQVPKDKINTVVLGTTSPLYIVEEYLSCIKSLVSNSTRSLIAKRKKKIGDRKGCSKEIRKIKNRIKMLKRGERNTKSKRKLKTMENKLCEAEELLLKEEDQIPQVINTMGWTAGMGLDLMLDTLKIVKPSHVIQIHNPQDPRNNFEVLLTSNYVHSSNGGMITQDCSRDDLTYDTLKVSAVNQYPVNGPSLRGNIIRDFKVLSEFSHLLKNEENDEILDIRVPWSIMALHVCGRQVPKENILQVLNASLVALCRIDSSLIVEPPRSDLPKHILFEELITHPAECLGWAVIQGIDPLTQHLHLLTRLTEEEVLQNVNAIIMTKQYLPQELYTYFFQGEGPYLQKVSDVHRTGANASTLDRRIMPRATQKQIKEFTEKHSSSENPNSQNGKFSTESKRSSKDDYEDSWT